jgi:hypothetical protein
MAFRKMNPLAEEMCRLLNLEPSAVTSITIRINAWSEPTVEVGMYVEQTLMAETIRTFEFVER